MKKLIFIVAIVYSFSLNVSIGQNQIPTFNAQNGSDWAGGTNNNAPNWANTLGTSAANSHPIYFATFGTVKAKLNSNYLPLNQYPINGFNPILTNINTSGYFLLGYNTFFNGKGPFSLLHLNDPNNTQVQELGYRTWMRTGITFTENRDRAYVGYRSSPVLDVSDFIINWSDNSVGGVGSFGPDNLIFNFSAGTGNNPGRIDGNQINGREVMC